ncbi:tyrosine-protein phosphatase [Sphingomonas sp. MMSM20]|uniref:tyrosine-protein phosphatase n=1 Tax=Sphingomonas lycopersici TaxID=2951807 RepID=UPI002238C646|nr:tyrosine-protein phosphatase [Sphingomonas lycopersici]MCW6530511.1 tyrosine-protein phosphatase [Sphingomonas lycopersici]
MSDRVLNFEGIHNFRDYGGYDTPVGRLRTGLLWRSGQHGAATAADLASLADLRISTVIDLRGDSERALAPCLRHDGFDGLVLFAPGETAGIELAPHEEAGRGITTAAEARGAMTRLYAAMPYRPILVRSLTLFFEALATRDGASLLHCLAGKDRTGLAAALLHRLLGVHADDVMADYLLTNTAGDPGRRIASAAASIRERYGPQMSDEAIVALMSVEADYLRTAFAAIDERHGGVEAYAAEVLGVDAARRQAIAARLVA